MFDIQFTCLQHQPSYLINSNLYSKPKFVYLYQKELQNLKTNSEWLLQADYDIKTAEAMYESGRYFYAVFMCHLSIEKCLKGIYCKILNELPPRTHNLIYLLEKMSLQPPENIYQFIYSINAESVATRYPDDIQRALKDYTKEKSLEIIKNSGQVLQWLKKN